MQQNILSAEIALTNFLPFFSSEVDRTGADLIIWLITKFESH